MEKIVDEYIKNNTWRTKNNANWNRSFSGLQSHISGTVLAKHALNNMGAIGRKHVSGDFHIHNLEHGILGRYCNGNDALSLLQRGLINVGGVNAKPAKHFATCLDQISNFTYLMTGEFAGAQAWRDLDILLAPYIHKDKLTYDTVKQDLQQFIWNLNFNMRPGFQTPFVNTTFGLRPNKYYDELPVLAGDVIQNSHYSDYQDEIDLFNRAFFDILIESPDGLSPFVFPMPTINITKDFKWENNDITDRIFELASKWGTPYFSNYINTDLSEEDALSMCCRLKLNLKHVQKFSGGIWSFGANTGSLAVFTINMSRIGYMANGNEGKFYKILDARLEDGKEYLLQKKKFIRDGSKHGLFPMTDTYVGEKLYKSYFLTIGHNALNECSINFCGKNIIENSDWCEEVLKYMSNKTLEFQQQTGHLFNFEATPAEGCSYSLARLDREKFPDIFTQGTSEEPYYTGSSLIPVNIEVSLPDAIRHQEKLQKHYTGGTVFHIDTGEMASSNSVKSVIKNTLENSSLPYVTWSPTNTKCPEHGNQNGKGCGCEKSVTWTRVVGYYRPTDRFNIGKKKEFSEKMFFKT
jgi:ribonucleoside-triphosphate reductase (formate)